jgi:hypothetical protein
MKSNLAGPGRGKLVFAFSLAVLFSVSLLPWSSFAGGNPDSVLASDKGKLRILVNGAQVGEEEFSISEEGGGWVARGSSELQTQQGPVHITGSLSLHPDGTPAHYEWSTQGPKKASSTVEFNGSSATAELHLEGMRPYTQQFTFNSPHIVVLDNNLYHQYGVLARLYDWSKGGSQTFSVLVPQEMTPGTITVVSVGKQDFNGKNCEQLVVKTEDLELDVYVDGPRLMGIVVPSSGAQIVRE